MGCLLMKRLDEHGYTDTPVFGDFWMYFVQLRIATIINKVSQAQHWPHLFRIQKQGWISAICQCQMFCNSIPRTASQHLLQLQQSARKLC